MKRIALVIGAAALAAALWGNGSEARDPDWSGLAAVAVSPDGKTVVVGGQNRVLYVVDAASFEVKKRIWTRARVGSLCFSKDGATLVLEDDAEETHLYDTSTWEPAKRLGTFGYVSFARNADLMAGATDTYGKKTVRFLSMKDGSSAGQAVSDERLAAFGLNADGTRLAALTSSDSKSGKEKKVPWNQIPKDLRGVDRKEFIQKNDGRTARLLLFEVPSGKLLSSAELWYTSDASTDILLDGEVTYVINYSNVCARITAKGETTVFEAGSINYGRGVAHDRKSFLVGGLRNGTYVVLDGMQKVKFSLDQLPGWPEYFAGFAVEPDGTGWGVTSACRLVKVGRDGRVMKAGPVY